MALIRLSDLWVDPACVYAIEALPAHEASGLPNRVVIRYGCLKNPDREAHAQQRRELVSEYTALIPCGTWVEACERRDDLALRVNKALKEMV